MTQVVVRGIGVCATGWTTWSAARATLRGETDYAPAMPSRDAPAGLATTERRRINTLSRLACLAAAEALAAWPSHAASSMATVFASSDGDGDVLGQMLRAISQPQLVVSPTVFHNSVFNAPAGYWSLAAHVTAPSTTVCADEASFAAGLLEATAQVAASERPVLLVAVDAPFPEPIGALTGSVAAFACALVLDVSRAGDAPAPLARLVHLSLQALNAAPGADPLVVAFGENAAAASLPLLRVLARGEGQAIALPYHDGTALRVDVSFSEFVGNEPTALLPQKGSMRMLDRIIFWDDTSIVCHSERHRASDNPLREHGRLGSIHAIEFAAQAMAAHRRLTQSDTTPLQGMLVSIRDCEFAPGPLDVCAAPLVITARRIAASAEALTYRFSVDAQGKAQARGRATVRLHTSTSNIQGCTLAR
jgi:predicted hotdog family 3-hydroxylacyl-ACP dehydratase